MSKPSECGSLAHLHSMIVDQIPDAVIAVGRDGCIMSWNRAAERLFGLSDHAVLGRRAHDVQLSPWFSAAEEGIIASVVERGDVSGDVQAILVRGGQLTAWSDPRRGGAAIGY